VGEKGEGEDTGEAMSEKGVAFWPERKVRTTSWGGYQRGKGGNSCAKEGKMGGKKKGTGGQRLVGEGRGSVEKENAGERKMLRGGREGIERRGGLGSGRGVAGGGVRLGNRSGTLLTISWSKGGQEVLGGRTSKEWGTRIFPRKKSAAGGEGGTFGEDERQEKIPSGEEEAVKGTGRKNCGKGRALVG